MYVVLEQINYYPYQVKLINTLRGKNQQINVREEEGKNVQDVKLRY